MFSGDMRQGIKGCGAVAAAGVFVWRQWGGGMWGGGRMGGASTTVC
jgi:hypothetical protein